MAVRSNIRKMYLFKFLLSLHFISAVLVPFFLEWGRISFFQVMLLQSWFISWIFVLEIPTGAMADYFGRRPVLIAAAIINAIGVLVYTSVANFYVFMIGEFLWALALAMMSGADESLVYDSLKSRKQERYSKKVLGRFHSLEMVGIMVAAPIGSVIAATLGLRWSMLLMAVPISLASVVAFSLKEPLRRTEKSISYVQTLKNGIKYFYSHKILKILAFDCVAINVLSFLIVWLLQPKLQAVGIDIAYFGIVVAAMTAMEAIIMNNFGIMERLVGSKKRYVFLSGLIPGAGFILLGLATNPLLVVALIVLIGGFGISRYPLFSNYMNKYIDSRNRATVMSTILMLDSLGLAVGYLVIGLLAEWSLNYTLVIIGALCILVAATSRVEEKHLID